MQAMDWDDLRYLLAAARAGTLAGAARRLGVDQTTVARRIAAAESTLGARLFDRQAGLLRPTRAGSAAIARAADVERDVGALRSAIAGNDAALGGVVRVTAVPILANRLLIPALPSLQRRHPGLRLELIGDPRNLSLSRREADIALRLARPESGGATLTRRIAELPYAVYAPARRRRRIWPWITYEEGLAHLPQARWIAKTAPGEEPALRVGDAEAIVAAIRAGIGQSLLPRFVGDDDPRMRRLGGTVLTREIWLLTHREIRAQARIAAALAWLEEVVSRL